MQGLLFFTDQDEKRLLHELSEMSNPNHLRLTKLALITGFRRSELLSLNWRDIDLQNNRLHVQRKECAARGSSSSMRMIPLSHKAKELLKSF